MKGDNVAGYCYLKQFINVEQIGEVVFTKTAVLRLSVFVHWPTFNSFLQETLHYPPNATVAPPPLHYDHTSQEFSEILVDSSRIFKNLLSLVSYRFSRWRLSCDNAPLLAPTSATSPRIFKHPSESSIISQSPPRTFLFFLFFQSAVVVVWIQPVGYVTVTSSLLTPPPFNSSPATFHPYLYSYLQYGSIPFSEIHH